MQGEPGASGLCLSGGHKQRTRIQITLVCVGDGDGDEGTDEGVADAVDEGVEEDGVVDGVALGEDCAVVDDAVGVADCAAWRGV